MFSKLTQILGFLPGNWDNIAAMVIIALVAVVALRIAFRVALRLARRVVNGADQVRRLAVMMTAFTGSGVAIPLTFEGALSAITKMF